MRQPRRSVLTALVLLFTPLTVNAQSTWRQYATPEEAGFASAPLETARLRADSLKSGAVLIVYRGHVLAAWGDVSRKLQLHSVRKSLTSALYGMAIAEGGIDLTATLASLGIDDTTRLSAVEKTAKVGDVIAARSGVYLPAAYAPSSQDEERPARGAHPPGTTWFYNNWDFNVAEWIYEERTGQSIYEAFEQRIAQPIGMEDYRPSDGFLAYEPGLSRYPAHTWRMSARDLARFGQLYLQRGEWSGKQIVPAEWVATSTKPISEIRAGRGYGYMWWTYTAGSYGDSYPELNEYASFAASGTGGQAIIVIPTAELVIVHRGDTDHNRHISGSHVWALAEAVLAARQGMGLSHPRLAALSPVPFQSQLPPLAQPTVLPVDPQAALAMVGQYDMGRDEHIRVSMFQGRPFLFLPGEGEAELLRVGADAYTIGVVPGVSIELLRNEAGAVRKLTLRLGGQVITAQKLP